MVWTPLAFAGSAVSPTAASACTPLDPQGPGELDVCEQTFDYSCPTQKDEVLGGYAAEDIPSGAVEVEYELTFGKSCPSATEVESFNPNAPPSPGPGLQQAKVTYAWTGSGASAGGEGTATFKVKFEEPVVPLEVQLLLTRSGVEAESAEVGQTVSRLVGLRNPNDDPVVGDLEGPEDEDTGLFMGYSNHSGIGWRPPPTDYDGLSCGILACRFSLPAFGEGSSRLDFSNQYAGEDEMEADARGVQISDGQKAGSNEARQRIKITAPRSDAQPTGPAPTCSTAAQRTRVLACTPSVAGVAFSGPSRLSVKGGYVTIPLENTNAFAVGGVFSLTGTTTGNNSARTSRAQVIGRKRFSIGAHGQARLKVAVSRQAKVQLSRGSRLKALASVALRRPAAVAGASVKRHVIVVPLPGG